ncbi:hypothetical protein COCMIDRAFT_104056 [Bipolaris oryzae ATCC 44560]|uniref:Uncharacterized protein n=1 Tax=Bipolaris oryzae ATCC 44560 TaxID=930090 RepID=W6YS16_COCMI|nr:uncharacterized protein COCMIDRAFT_104056 [Bipolaris oryzae ATCC 44560]EUC42232.1 hypothetical protein COCMIDRAFT_104056 [Bipolaris oryzae ATCC 44560]
MPHHSPRAAILQPFRSNYLPSPTANAPLFLPADARRHWYLGYVYLWKSFKSEAIEYFNHEQCVEAFRQLYGFQVEMSHATFPSPYASLPAPASLEAHFSHEVLQPVEKIYNSLLTTQVMRNICSDNMPQGIWLESGAQNEELAAKGVKPAFIIRSKAASGEDEVRMLGHAEYLGGKPGALTSAIRNAGRNTWGSLRCVLGDIARWMLECNTEYGFLVSSDEIMFLRFAIVHKGKKMNVAQPGEPEHVAFVYTIVEPSINYSDPIKHNEVLDEKNGTVPVRLALLYLLHTTVVKRFQMPKQKGNAAHYFPTTEAGKRFTL